MIAKFSVDRHHGLKEEIWVGEVLSLNSFKVTTLLVNPSAWMWPRQRQALVKA